MSAGFRSGFRLRLRAARGAINHRHQHGHFATGHTERSFEHFNFFFWIKCRGFAERPADDDAINAGITLQCKTAFHFGDIQPVVCCEFCGDGRKNTVPERMRHDFNSLLKATWRAYSTGRGLSPSGRAPSCTGLKQEYGP